MGKGRGKKGEGKWRGEGGDSKGSGREPPLLADHFNHCPRCRGK